ncbi:DNA polymerase alpha catalytic subunit, putative [Theileria equi strain WA]|uniref:DNA polymerase alpha catalytic subunit, putative n=1 Tax=Theileria equi strain WA TaxID=1537102 RepID=L1LBM0_THEEQ|nr:DNA polymerase alpha catalytic subunit, putative [Theileria equi strain WA]EKX72573.1 DNA polymerase alpha catalytic subunit, putative [Theileria equi strain WA]|eukprot:XP_004832025.1 DNA polymerase alpha catalytic subunit, putative [Theileria equi strain WA]
MAKKASSVSSALSKIRNQRTGKTSALDEYEVEDENDRIYEVITEEEYNERNRKRRLDDFIEGGGFSEDEMDDDLDDIEDQVERTSRRGSQKPHPSGKSIQQHFVEMAASSTTYQPSKPVENDASMLKKLSNFEDELDNDGGAYGSFPGQFSMPSQMGMQTQFGTPLMPTQLSMPLIPGASFSHLPGRGIYSGPLDGVAEAEIDPSLIESFGEVESSQVETMVSQSSDVQPSDEEVVNIDAIKTENESDIPLYLLDLCEGPAGNLHLFGRILSNKGENTESCMVTVKNVMRCLFFKPRMELMFTETGEITDMLVDGVVLKGNPLFERHLMKNFYNEMEVLRKDYGIKKIMYKLVKRKLLKYGPSTEELYIKVCYPYAFPQLGKHHFSGTCYSDVYGVNSPITELFLVKRKIKGPSWLRLRGAVVSSQNLSTCKVELEVESHKSVSLWVSKDSEEIAVPQISIAAISVKTCFVTPNQPEIFEIAMVYNKKCSIDDMSVKEVKSDNQFIGIRKLPSFQWPKEMKAFLSKRPYFRIYEQERGMLAHFMKFLETIDPDVVVSHDTHQLVLETLLKRCNALNIPLRVSFSRLKLGKKMTTPFTAGRLFCDTRMLTKELYPGRGNYDLSACVYDLVTKAPPKDSNFYTRNAFTMGEVKRCFGDAPDSMKNLLVMAQANSKFALDSFNLLLKIQALPLTKELTNIAGNTWNRSIQCARSERNDFLLMHEFHRHKYILDHTFEKHSISSKNAADDWYHVTVPQQ